MKYLFVGDIHNHDYMFNDIYRLDKEYNFNRIILFGDYVDDWNTDNHKSLETLNTVISMKQNMKDKFTLLLGNHELSYLGYPCSGHRKELEEVVTQKLEENIDLFDFYTSVMCDYTEYVCTHAGLTNGFIENYLGGKDNFVYILSTFNKNKLKSLLPFTVCSHLRGGKDTYSSSMWCDLREHIYYSLQDYIVPYQIVGHTPVSKVYNMTNSTNQCDIKFIDTHSTYSNGEPYGDKSYLIWDDDEFKTVY